MDKTKQVVLDLYKFKLRHYFETGIGGITTLSYTCQLTPIMVRTCLDRYIELGGDEDFSDITDERYKEFLLEARCSNVKSY